MDEDHCAQPGRGAAAGTVFGRGPVRLLRAGTRQNTESLADWTAKTDIDHDQAVEDTRPGPLNCLFSGEELDLGVFGACADALDLVNTYAPY